MLRMEKKQTLLLPILIFVFLTVRFFFVQYINDWLGLDTADLDPVPEADEGPHEVGEEPGDHRQQTGEHASSYAENLRLICLYSSGDFVLGHMLATAHVLEGRADNYILNNDLRKEDFILEKIFLSAEG